MSAHIRSQFSRDDYGNWQCETISFFVYDPNSPFVGTSYEASAWRFLGNASRYLPAIPGYNSHPIHLATVAAPNMPEAPITFADTWSDAGRYFEAYAEMWLSIAGIEAERESWFGAMREAEAAEARAHAILTDSSHVAPF